MDTQDNLYQQYRNAAEKAEAQPFAAMDKVWDRIEEKLDKKKEKNTFPFWKVSMAAAILLLIGISGFLLFQKKELINPYDKTIVKVPAAKPQPANKNIEEDKKSLADNRGVTKAMDRVENKKGTNIVFKNLVPQHDTTRQKYIQEEKMISGILYDENGEAVIGASIKIDGTNEGTISDANGKYELKMTDAAQSLSIQAIGYEKQVISNILTDTLLATNLQPSAVNYNEVAIYGQKIDRKSYTGSVSIIGANDIARRPVTDITKALQGAAPGIAITSGGGQPGTSPDIVIRGLSSVGANKSPLIVLDGAPYKDDLSSINPKDVAEMRILKDANATSMYGARGANGVIIITTKNGKLGSKQQRSAVGRSFQKIKKLFRNPKTGKVTSQIEVPQQPIPQAKTEVDNEVYETFEENKFDDPAKDPLSTFSIDVDNASYTNIRRFIQNGQKVPKDAVRIEEMINFFKYNYAQPKGKHPFGIATEYSQAPWNPKHQLLKIGLQGKEIPEHLLPASNLVFLIDVSGSMSDDNKLPLLKSSMKLLVSKLRKDDVVSIVVYAGAAGLVLPPTHGNEKEKIIAALDELRAGGSTAGGQGIELAYKIATENFIKKGNNRIILATDGDFNVGSSSNESMQALIEEKRKSNILLTCLGYGMGNYKDSKMEILANKGNGNYAYIDNLKEANRVLVKEFGGTLFSIAKDVKIQIEFNPKHVQSYRLIGYENRKLRAEDFSNDAIDAGELGSGHSVTALYEIIPIGVKSEYFPYQPDLKYSKAKPTNTDKFADELATIKFRYKKPGEDESIEMVNTIKTQTITLQDASPDFKWASAVAWFGLKLRDSKLIPNKNTSAILDWVQQGKAYDLDGYKKEFIDMVKAVQ